MIEHNSDHDKIGSSCSYL